MSWMKCSEGLLASELKLSPLRGPADNVAVTFDIAVHSDEDVQCEEAASDG